MNDELRKSIDEIKLRSPIEEVVRERVPDLKRKGRLWEACCPFHEERTPSFKVDPERQTWHCFGACSTGGDAIRFVERSQNVEFMEALRYLAARAGVTLPDRQTERDRRENQEHAALYEALARTAEFYKRALHTEDGARALAYLQGRGLERGTLDAFGVGYAPAGGEVLVRRARSAGMAEEALFGAGLARKDERGRAYDFFRDRLVIPIRDLKGRTVGFGGRRLADGDPAVPKYVNTPETGVFHKGRVIYALDLALEHVRRSGHLILVEGYTDVMAAHQAGVRTVVAVLGTATTEDHALLVRRSGARRVSLVFDGDDAGRKATYKALAGLLGLDVSIDVVRIPGDEDPCDLLIREGRAPFDAALARAVPWFEFVLGALAELAPTQRSRGLDQALELVGRLPRALDRDAHLGELAARLSFPVAAVREQFESLPERARERARAAARATPAPAPVSTGGATRPAPDRGDGRVRQAFGEMVGAAILHAELAADLGAWRELCPDAELRSLFDVVGALPSGEERDGVRVQALLSALADDPARGLVVPLLEHVERAEDPRAMYAGAKRYLERWQEQRCIDEGSKVLGSGDDTRILAELHQRLRRIKVPLTEPS